MRVHELKLDTKYFEEVKNGTKNFEIRNNDRDFKMDDVLELKAFKRQGDLEGYAKKDSSGDGYHIMGSDCCFYESHQADTIKVKVTDIWDAACVNRAMKPFESGVLWSITGKNVFTRNVKAVLLEYFRTNHLPLDFVVLGIEVIE